MKITAFFLLLASSASLVLAQDPKTNQAQFESQAPKKEEKKAPVTTPKPADQVLGKKVVYSGYFTDFVRAEKKRPLFNLKAPLDYQKDSENLSYYPNTEKVQGVVLFSIKF